MAWWSSERTLLVADTHFGKAATFRQAGVPVPRGTTTDMLFTLTQTIEATQAKRLIVLGDFIHSAVHATVDFEEELMSWRQTHETLQLQLVKGNHDRHRQKLFQRLEMEIYEGDLQCESFVLCHDPTDRRKVAERASNRATLAQGNGGDVLPAHFRVGGHLHPGIRIASNQKLPCFWLGEDFLVFPAFGLFTGLSAIAPEQRDQIFVIAEGHIAKIAPPSREGGATYF